MGTGRPSVQQSKRAAAQAVVEAEARVWEKFGEAKEEDYRSALRKFWLTIWHLRRGSPPPALFTEEVGSC